MTPPLSSAHPTSPLKSQYGRSDASIPDPSTNHFWLVVSSPIHTRAVEPMIWVVCVHSEVKSAPDWIFARRDPNDLHNAAAPISLMNGFAWQRTALGVRGASNVQPAGSVVHAPLLQMGAPPLHTVESAHCPLASHVCTVLVTPLLHRVAPVVHSLQVPALHAPVSEPTVQDVPSALFARPHALLAQVAWRHVLVGLMHWDALVHCTQLVVVGLQYGAGATQLEIGSYCPLLLQVSTPLPLHTLLPGEHAWQTPVTLHVPPLQTVP